MEVFLKLIFGKWLEDNTEPVVRAAMEKHVPEIVAGMEAKGMTLAKAAPPLVVRDALFRLWRSIIPSGDISDFLRDHYETKVKAKVVPTLDAATDTTETVVRRTLAAQLEIIF